MGIDYDALMLQPIYDRLGVDAEVTTGAGTEKTLRVMDKSAGIAVALGDLNVGSLKPAAAVRMATLAEEGLKLADLDGGQILLKGGLWRIKGWLPPGDKGDSKGEAFLLLTDEKLGR